MATDRERIASLEAQQEVSEKVHDELFDQVKEIRGDVAEIKQRLSGWRGFLGGAMFVLTSIGGLIGAALMSLWQTLTGGH